MIGRLVLSDRNIFKIKLANKQVSARKCYILSDNNKLIKESDGKDLINNNNILLKTSKEFNPKDEYIKFDPETKTIMGGLGTVGNILSDFEIYYHLYTLNWLSESKYSKLWDAYMFGGENKLIDFDQALTRGFERTLYTNQVITIDPFGSLDLDDGFSFSSDSNYYWLDIHIADPVSWLDLSNPICIDILKELNNRLQSCYIGLNTSEQLKLSELSELSELSKLSKLFELSKPTHLLPTKVVKVISLLELELNDSNKIKSRRAVSFCFKISKQTKLIEEFNGIKFTNLVNIKNYSYEQYNEELNKPSNFDFLTELVGLTNCLIDVIGLRVDKGFEPISTNTDITHKMIEIFMILTNWYGGNHLINNIGWNKTILRTQMPSQFDEEFDITKVPIWARPILSKSANYSFGNRENIHQLNGHFSLGITNYAHLSSPMRRFVDMLNHFGLYQLEPNDFMTPSDLNPWNLEQINRTVMNQKKISNGYDLLRFIKTNSNIFRACLFNYVKLEGDECIKSTLVLYQEEHKFIRVVNVELPQTSILDVNNLSKYMEFNVELYYNSNNFKSSKFPFSIKII